MKKIILALALVLTLLTLTACTDKPEAPISEEGYKNDPATDAIDSESVACYYSLLTELGFENYILAFPAEWRRGYQELLEYDDETFAEALKNATESLHTQRDQDYEGYPFNIEYELVSEREVTGSELDSLVKELVDYCFMTKSTIEKMKAQTYSVHTYALADDGSLVNSQTVEEELYLVFIKDDGWYVSPHEYTLP